MEFHSLAVRCWPFWNGDLGVDAFGGYVNSAKNIKLFPMKVEVVSEDLRVANARVFVERDGSAWLLTLFDALFQYPLIDFVVQFHVTNSCDLRWGKGSQWVDVKMCRWEDVEMWK